MNWYQIYFRSRDQVTDESAKTGAAYIYTFLKKENFSKVHLIVSDKYVRWPAVYFKHDAPDRISREIREALDAFIRITNQTDVYIIHIDALL